MAFRFDESPDSGEMSSASPSYTLRYKASGDDSDSFVWSYALAATPAIVSTPVGTLYRQDVQISPIGFAVKSVTVPYGPKKNETGSYTWNFDTTGATVKIKAAKEHIASYDSGGAATPANRHKGAIGVKADGDVEGADVIIPALKLNVSFRHPSGVITIAQAKNLARATGTTNAAPFLDFATGELLFLGASGSDGSEAEAEVTYQFAASENVTDLSFGDIANIVKQGHHYAWIEFEDTVESDNPATKPRIVHIERVYDAINFASVFGWG